ncbi:MAG: hypothetical protein ACYTCU_05155, partial [Planctomycetota bacterium]
MRRARWTSTLCIAAVALLSACLWPRETVATTHAGAAQAAATTDMAALITEYGADERSVRRFESIPFSERRLAMEDRLAARWTARLDAIDFDALDTGGRIDWL